MNIEELVEKLKSGWNGSWRLTGEEEKEIVETVMNALRQGRIDRIPYVDLDRGSIFIRFSKPDEHFVLYKTDGM